MSATHPDVPSAPFRESDSVLDVLLGMTRSAHGILLSEVVWFKFKGNISVFHSAIAPNAMALRRKDPANAATRNGSRREEPLP